MQSLIDYSVKIVIFNDIRKYFMLYFASILLFICMLYFVSLLVLSHCFIYLHHALMQISAQLEGVKRTL